MEISDCIRRASVKIGCYGVVPYLIDMQNFIAERVVLFDERDAQVLTSRCERLQDDVTNWLQDYILKKRRNREEMRELLLSAQREILKLPYDCEVKNF